MSCIERYTPRRTLILGVFGLTLASVFAVAAPEEACAKDRISLRDLGVKSQPRSDFGRPGKPDRRPPPARRNGLGDAAKRARDMPVRPHYFPKQKGYGVRYSRSI